LCDAELQEILMLLDRVVQNSQGVLLQLQTSCEMVPAESPARDELKLVLKKAEMLLDVLRDEADTRTQRLRGPRESR
jgi:hypothetical protein